MKILTKATSYTISSSSGLADTTTALEFILKDGRTYKSSAASAAGNITLSASATDLALAYQGMTVNGAIADNAKGAAMVHSASSISWTSGSNAAAVVLYAGTAYDFPALPNAAFTPATFSDVTTYHNSISGMGEFVGRSVIRSGQAAQIKPLSFIADGSKLTEIRKMLDEMKEAPFFVEHDAPDGKVYTYYGWTDSDPKVSYIGTLNYVDVSFAMKVWGSSIR